MNVTVVYVIPILGQPHFDNASRFIATYNLYPAEHEHRLLVVTNGGKPGVELSALIDQFNHSTELLEHDNSGWDIGAFQAAAAQIRQCDLIVFFGTTAYLRGSGWLKRMVEAFSKHGPNNLYGSTANNGNMAVGVYPHIRTTGFYMAPGMMNVYPLRVKHANLRYESEHGSGCITQWFRNNGHRTLMVTWDGEYEWPYWDSIPNGYHNGDQRNLIVGDRLTAPPYYPVP